MEKSADVYCDVRRRHQNAIVGVRAQHVRARIRETDGRRRLAVGYSDLTRIERHRFGVAAIDDPDDAEAHAAIEAHDRLTERSFDARIRSALARATRRPAVVDDERVER